MHLSGRISRTVVGLVFAVFFLLFSPQRGRGSWDKSFNLFLYTKTTTVLKSRRWSLVCFYLRSLCCTYGIMELRVLKTRLEADGRGERYSTGMMHCRINAHDGRSNNTRSVQTSHDAGRRTGLLKSCQHNGPADNKRSEFLHRFSSPCVVSWTPLPVVSSNYCH